MRNKFTASSCWIIALTSTPIDVPSARWRGSLTLDVRCRIVVTKIFVKYPTHLLVFHTGSSNKEPGLGQRAGVRAFIGREATRRAFLTGALG